MSAPVAIAPPSVLVEIDVADAISCGQTMRTLARDSRTPAGVRALIDRVGTQLANAGLRAVRT